MRIVVIGIAVLLLGAGTASAEKTAATKSLAKCQQVVGKESQKLAAVMERAVASCLQLVSDQVVTLGGDGPAAAAAPKCAKTFRAIADSRQLGKSAAEKFHAKVLDACDPTGHAHTLADVLGTNALVPEPLDVADLALWCTEFGGDGTIDDVAEWAECMANANACRGAQVAASRYPRALEWLAAVRAAIQALPAGGDPAANTDAVSVLDAFVRMLDPNHDDALDTRCGGGSLCPAGSFGIEGKTPCASCPAGFFSATTGAAACTACDPGTFASTPGATTCVDCAVGKYAAEAGSAVCDSCPAGTFSSAPGATVCTDCAIGHFASTPASTTCSTCAAGTYQDRTRSSGCVSCPPGFHAADPGSIACVACPTGTFAANLGATSCTTCAIGQFQNDSGQTACKQCPPGTFGVEPGASSCAPCAPGKYNELVGQTECSDCPAGSYGNLSGQTFCPPCPPGRFSAISGTTACVNCEPGKYIEQSGATECTDCPADTYAPASGLSQCFPCEGAPTAATSCDCSVP